MTNKEAIEVLKHWDGYFVGHSSDDVNKALMMAIQALEQQPRTNLAKTSQDCISRTELLAKIDEERKHLLELKMDGAEHIIVHHARRIIEDMPPVTPSNADTKEAYLKGYDYGVKDWFRSKTQPCEDAVSREAVKNGMIKYGFHAPDMTVTEFVEDCLPSVTPKYTDEEIDKIQAVEQAYVDKMVELAVEEARRPKGKWIRVVDKAGHWVWECDCKWQQRFATNYCPNCGAEMSGGGEDEVGYD